MRFRVNYFFIVLFWYELRNNLVDIGRVLRTLYSTLYSVFWYLKCHHDNNQRKELSANLTSQPGYSANSCFPSCSAVPTSSSASCIIRGVIVPPSPEDRPNEVDLYSLYRVQAQSPESRVRPEQRRISMLVGQFGRGPGKHP